MSLNCICLISKHPPWIDRDLGRVWAQQVPASVLVRGRVSRPCAVGSTHPSQTGREWSPAAQLSSAVALSRAS